MKFMRSARFHKWMAAGWMATGLPACVLYAESVFEFLVLFMSLYAIVIGHWDGYQSARAEKAAKESS
jgi:hypothetical protein